MWSPLLEHSHLAHIYTDTALSVQPTTDSALHCKRVGRALVTFKLPTNRLHHRLQITPAIFLGENDLVTSNSSTLVHTARKNKSKTDVEFELRGKLD